MTETIQPRSWVLINHADNDLNKPKVRGRMNLLLSVYDTMNSFHESLNRLDYLLKRVLIELTVYNDEIVKRERENGENAACSGHTDR